MRSDELDHLGEVTLGEEGEIAHQVLDGVFLMPGKDTGFTTPDILLSLDKRNWTLFCGIGRSVNETFKTANICMQKIPHL